MPKMPPHPPCKRAQHNKRPHRHLRQNGENHQWHLAALLAGLHFLPVGHPPRRLFCPAGIPVRLDEQRRPGHLRLGQRCHRPYRLSILQLRLVAKIQYPQAGRPPRMPATARPPPPRRKRCIWSCFWCASHTAVRRMGRPSCNTCSRCSVLRRLIQSRPPAGGLPALGRPRRIPPARNGCRPPTGYRHRHPVARLPPAVSQLPPLTSYTRRHSSPTSSPLRSLQATWQALQPEQPLASK